MTNNEKNNALIIGASLIGFGIGTSELMGMGENKIIYSVISFSLGCVIFMVLLTSKR